MRYSWGCARKRPEVAEAKNLNYGTAREPKTTVCPIAAAQLKRCSHRRHIGMLRGKHLKRAALELGGNVDSHRYLEFNRQFGKIALTVPH